MPQNPGIKITEDQAFAKIGRQAMENDILRLSLSQTQEKLAKTRAQLEAAQKELAELKGEPEDAAQDETPTEPAAESSPDETTTAE